ncbi:MAG: hypothetical protein RI560_04385, partial [Natronomonas sp.]|nr:hypothetical protein [Natronomonas sp.]
ELDDVADPPSESSSMSELTRSPSSTKPDPGERSSALVSDPDDDPDEPDEPDEPDDRDPASL